MRTRIAVLVVGALLTGCPADPGQPELQAVTGPEDVGDLPPRALVPSHFIGWPGNGWDLLHAHEGVFACLGGPVLTTSAPATTRRFQRPFTPAELEGMVGFGPETAERLRLLDADEDARLFRPFIVPPPLQYARAYGVEERITIETLDPSAATLLADPADPDFAWRCRDVVLSGRELGGHVLLLLSIEFDTQEAADAFARLVGADPGLPELFERLATAEAQAALRGHTRLSMALQQLGGDVLRLGSLATGLFLGGCDVSRPGACAAFAESLLAYATGDAPDAFPAQLQRATTATTAEPAGAHLAALAYRLAPWSELIPGAPAPRIAPHDVLDAREALRALADERLVVANRLRALEHLYYGFGTTTWDVIEAGMEQTYRDMAALRAAANSCYALTAVDDAAAIAACTTARAQAVSLRRDTTGR